MVVAFPSRSRCSGDGILHERAQCQHPNSNLTFPIRSEVYFSSGWEFLFFFILSEIARLVIVVRENMCRV